VDRELRASRRRYLLELAEYQQQKVSSIRRSIKACFDFVNIDKSSLEARVAEIVLVLKSIDVQMQNMNSKLQTSTADCERLQQLCLEGVKKCRVAEDVHNKV
jgi:hypothetical protein